MAVCGRSFGTTAEGPKNGRRKVYDEVYTKASPLRLQERIDLNGEEKYNGAFLSCTYAFSYIERLFLTFRTSLYIYIRTQLKTDGTSKYETVAVDSDFQYFFIRT